MSGGVALPIRAAVGVVALGASLIRRRRNHRRKQLRDEAESQVAESEMWERGSTLSELPLAPPSREGSIAGMSQRRAPRRRRNHKRISGPDSFTTSILRLGYAWLLLATVAAGLWVRNEKHVVLVTAMFAFTVGALMLHWGGERRGKAPPASASVGPERPPRMRRRHIPALKSNDAGGGSEGGGGEDFPGISMEALAAARAAGIPDPCSAPHGPWIPVTAASLSGKWKKEMERSDPYNEICAEMRLNFLVTKAVNLIRGLDITLEEGAGGDFNLGIFSALPMFKLWERYRVGGEIALNRRRDLRKGKFKGAVYIPPGREFLSMRFRWPAPHGGSGSDVFVMRKEGELEVITTMCCDGFSPHVYHSYYLRE